MRKCCPSLPPLSLSVAPQLEDGSAEVFGTELQLGQSVAITGQKVAVGALGEETERGRGRGHSGSNLAARRSAEPDSSHHVPGLGWVADCGTVSAGQARSRYVGAWDLCEDGPCPPRRSLPMPASWPPNATVCAHPAGVHVGGMPCERAGGARSHVSRTGKGRGSRGARWRGQVAGLGGHSVAG